LTDLAGIDLRGRSCLVTGASSGIGRQAARELARLGARVVMACRSRERGEQARRAIAAEVTDAQLELRIVDLSSRRSTRDFAAAFAQDHPRLDVLVNNAGTWSSRRRVTGEGVEATWATNVLGYFQLTELLRDRLAAAAPSRIVNVASLLARDLDLDDVEFRRRRYAGVSAYAQSKQANRMWTWALARRLEGTGVTANALHPGAVNTPLFSKGGGLLALGAAVWARLFGRSVREGADTAVWLAASPEAGAEHGKFWIDRRPVRCRYRDQEQEERLWRLCAQMAGGNGR
jgi:NAD(P)-dependent dehydrogenase (short-subunit alcohol dehydrogenase family)